MTEAIVSGLISLVVFAIGYGRLIEKIDNGKEGHIKNVHDIDSIKSDLKIVTDLRVDLAEIKKDIHYIKENISS